jgi:hypothetical protein
MHVLHEITERVGQLGELLAFRRILPLEKILEEGIVGAVARLVGIEVGVVSGVFDLESPGVSALGMETTP